MAALSMLLAICLSASAEGESASAAGPPDETGLPGVFETHSSRAMRTGAWLLGVSDLTLSGLSMIEDAKVTVVPAGEPGGDKTLDGAVSSLRGFLAGGLGLGFDLALQVPWYYERLPGARDKAGLWSLGDVSAILLAELPWEIPYTSFSVFALASVPTSSDNGAVLPKRLGYHPARDRYPDPVANASGFKNADAGLGAGVSFHLGQEALGGPQVAVHANLSADRALASKGNPRGNLAASLAAEAYLSPWLRMEGELRHQLQVTDPDGLANPAGRATTLGAGLGCMAPYGLSLRLGGVIAPLDWNPYRNLVYRDGDGGEMAMKYRGQPTLSGFLQVAWQGFPIGRDTDHDGIPDSRDKCPLVPEDRDGFQDEDGCPDPDNDADGIPDAADGCPYIPEDHDGFEDQDGCPEPDNDHDGILDAADHCPNDAEDMDGYQDEDGCPEPDNDNDGICDPWVAERGQSPKYADVCRGSDKCPEAAENRNGIEDEDGCPEMDTDGDGIPDSRDKCPNEKEIINFYQDEDGCPDEKPEPIRDAVLTGVEFQTGGAELLPGSFPVLDGLAARMSAYPGTEIEIQGHLDDRAGAGAKALSQARAEAVAEYLINKSIESRRMKPAGYGSSKPLASNRTAQGRAANRRVEIHRLN